MNRLTLALSISFAELAVGIHSAVANELLRKAQDLKPSADCASTRIVGGNSTCIEKWSWQVALYSAKNSGQKRQQVFLCGGSVIGDRWVLTAGHCVAGKGQARDFSVLTGETRAPLLLGKARKGAQVSQVRNVFLHEEFHDSDYDGRKIENDIALLELEGTLPIAPVKILRHADVGLEAAGKSADLIGFGSLRPSDKDGRDQETGAPLSFGQVAPERLMHVAIPLVDTRQCAIANEGKGGTIDERTLCAGVPQGGLDTCQGDSGGPMTVKSDDGSHVQIGVVSWGHGCGKSGYPGVYTRVSAFADWIDKKTRNLIVEPDAAHLVPRPPSQEQAPAGFDNAAGVNVTIAQGDALRIGQAVTLRATTQKPGYLVLLDVTADERMVQIFPNAASLRTPMGQDQRGNVLAPERPRSIGDVMANPYEGFSYTVDPPKGQGALIAILSETPITSVDIPSMPKSFSKAEGDALLGRIRNELMSRHVQQQEDGKTMNWSIEIHPYTVE